MFDKKKSIIIPKITEKSGSSSNKPEVAKVEPIQNGNPMTTFERPKSYIIYSEKDRAERNIKEYEASSADMEYLKKNDNFISTEEFENAVSALENDVGKGEMIPQERAFEVLSKLFPNRRSEYDKIFQVGAFSFNSFFNLKWTRNQEYVIISVFDPFRSQYSQLLNY